MNDYEYKELINPINLFKTENELKDFIRIGNDIDGLKEMLKICEKEELYIYCSIINERIKELENTDPNFRNDNN